MTINNAAWKDLAEKYNTKAKWAEAILMLNMDENEDLMSALIELSPEDVLNNTSDTGDARITINGSDIFEALNISDILKNLK